MAQVVLTDVVKKYVELGAQLRQQRGAGEPAHFRDEAFANVTVVDEAEGVFAESDVVLCVQPPSLEHIAQMKPGTVLLGGVLFAALGFFDGFFGPGVGSFLLLVFVRLYGYDYLHAAASARVINLSSNTAAVLYFGYFGHVSWLLGAAMAASNLAGAQAGTVLALRHGSRLIRSVFIVVVCILIVKTGRDAWWAG